jgi:arsenate reductase-like glutaredoxin family protein
MKDNQICYKCKVEKPILEFHKNKRNSSGYCYECKVCTAIRVKKWNEENPDHKKKEDNTETHICYKCKVEKPWSEFYNNKNKPGGHDYECKTCKDEHVKEWVEANPDSKREYSKKATKKYREAHKESPEWKLKRRVEQLKYKYDLTLEQVELMRTAQDNKCAICQNPFIETPDIDHCHKTGKVRSLLCARCNKAIGSFEDSPGLLNKALTYILAHSQ